MTTINTATNTATTDVITEAERPAPGPARDYRFPTFTRQRLANGLQLLVAPIHRFPVVTVSAVIEAGAVSETRLTGVAALTARALLEGAGTLDGEALTDQLEQLGTAIDASADWDVTMLNMTVLAAQLRPALARFADVLMAPQFPADGVTRLAGEQLADLLQVESEPRALADERFSHYVYAPDSRYTIPINGTKSSVSSLTRDDVIAFYRACYMPGTTTLIVAGDITHDDALALVTDTFASWQGVISEGAPSRGATSDQPATVTPGVHIVRRTDAPQSEVRVGHVGVPYPNADVFPITVMNAVFGGLFGSRINLNLREAHGYTYGARSAFDWRRNAGPFMISTAVANPVTAPSVHEILVEIDRIRRDPITDDELSLATQYLDGVFPIRFETTAAVASALAALVVYDLDEQWYDTYRSRIRSVTAADVLRAAQTYLHPDRLQIVVVGDPAAIQAPLEAMLRAEEHGDGVQHGLQHGLQLAPLEVHDV